MQDDWHRQFLFIAQMTLQKGFDHHAGIVHLPRLFECLRFVQCGQFDQTISTPSEVIQYLVQVGMILLQQRQPSVKPGVGC